MNKCVLKIKNYHVTDEKINSLKELTNGNSILMIYLKLKIYSEKKYKTNDDFFFITVNYSEGKFYEKMTYLLDEEHVFEVTQSLGTLIENGILEIQE